MAETGVGEYPVEAVRAMAGIAEAAEEMPDIHGRARGFHPQTPSATVLHTAAQLAAELAAAALVIPTETGGAPQACREIPDQPTDHRVVAQPGAPQFSSCWSGASIR